MAGIYNIQWANGASFQVFTAKSKIEIVGSVADRYDGLQVFFIDSNLGEGSQEVTAVSNDGYTIEITLAGSGANSRAVMVEWLEGSAQVWTLFGEVFVGDPDGAGGFGGEQNTEGGTPLSKRR
jgi:hypothetical protein